MPFEMLQVNLMHNHQCYGSLVRLHPAGLVLP